MTLTNPHPGFYTRPKLGVDQHGRMMYGEKTYHFVEDPEAGITHDNLRMLSNGLDMDMFLDMIGDQDGIDSRGQNSNNTAEEVAFDAYLERLNAIIAINTRQVNPGSAGEAREQRYPLRKLKAWAKGKFR